MRRETLRDRVFTEFEVAIVAGPVWNRIGEFRRFDAWDADIIDVGVLADALLFELREQAVQAAVIGCKKEIFVVKDISQLHGDIGEGYDNSFPRRLVEKIQVRRDAVVVLPDQGLYPSFIGIVLKGIGGDQQDDRSRPDGVL